MDFMIRSTDWQLPNGEYTMSLNYAQFNHSVLNYVIADNVFFWLSGTGT